MSKKGLKTLAEWNKAVEQKSVKEPNRPVGRTPNTGIGCPNVDLYGRVCGAHLIDVVDQTFQDIIEPRRAIYCMVCGWLGCRKIARKGHV